MVCNLLNAEGTSSEQKKMYAPQFPAMHIGAPPPPQLVLLRFENASVTTERTEVATLCSQFGEVAYVDFRFGEQIGYVRFRRPEAARAAIDALTMYPQQVDGVVPTWRLLGIDETREYWASAKSSKAASVMNAAAEASLSKEAELAVIIEASNTRDGQDLREGAISK